jgi:predicted nuclease of predicted toxin-antitoxin system
MKFLVDENVKLRLATFLVKKGYDVKLVAKRSSDKEVSLLAQKESRIILTHDSDFGNPVLFPPLKYPGIIILRVMPPTLPRLSLSLENLLLALKPREFKGKTIILLDEHSFWVEE